MDECQELVEKTYDRIGESELNAFITLTKRDALETAKRVDKGELGGKLAGVPIVIKDNISTADVPTTCASRILNGYVPLYDAHVVELLRKEGAIIIGKANMDEFAMGTSTETSYFGPVRNPHDLSRVAGGSSGGSAAAVASGEAVMALGSDTGGSIRCPAAFCGIFGLKPTYGLVSRYGLIAYANSLEQIGPMCANTRDVALLLDVISEKDKRDSTQVGSQVNYLDALSDDTRLKLGVPKEFFGPGVYEGVEKAVWNSIKKFEDLGCTYEEVSIPNMKYALAAYYIIAMSEVSSNLARFDGVRYGLRFETDEDWHTTFSKIRGAGFGKEAKRRIILGTYALSAGYYGKYYLKALKVRTLIKQDLERALKNIDLLVTPTMPFPAFKLGEKIEDPLSLYLADVNTAPVNLAGLPAVSIPAGFSGGLPIGLQLAGGFFEEKKLLKASFTFERNNNLISLP